MTCARTLGLAYATILLLVGLENGPAVAGSLQWDAGPKVCFSRAPTLEACSAVIQNKPDSAKILGVAYYNRGIIYWRKQDYGRASSDLTHAIRLMPDRVQTYWWRGAIEISEKKSRAAFKDFDMAIRLDPKNAGSYYNRGEGHLKLEQYSAALSDYKVAARIDPIFSLAWSAAAYSSLKLGRPETAISDASRAIRLNAHDYKSFGIRGYAYAKLHRYALAQAEFETSLKFARNPDDMMRAAPRYVKGLAELAAGQTDNGNADIAAAKDISPAISEAFTRNGVVP